MGIIVLCFSDPRIAKLDCAHVFHLPCHDETHRTLGGIQRKIALMGKKDLKRNMSYSLTNVQSYVGLSNPITSSKWDFPYKTPRGIKQLRAVFDWILKRNLGGIISGGVCVGRFKSADFILFLLHTSGGDC